MLWDIVEGIFSAIARVIVFFVGKTKEAGAHPDIVVVVAIIVLVTIWLWSATWASSIAGCRRHPEKMHFFIGLLFPVVYPITILFTLDVRGAKERAEQMKKEAEEQAEVERMKAEARAMREEDEGGGPGSTADGAEQTVIGQTFDAEYFENIALDEQGNVTGPWLIRFGANEVVAQRIIDPLDTGVSIAIQGNGEELQTIRIPYAKITSCEPA